MQGLSVNAFHIGKAPCGTDSCQITDKKTQTITEMFPIWETAAILSLVHPISIFCVILPTTKSAGAVKLNQIFN